MFSFRENRLLQMIITICTFSLIVMTVAANQANETASTSSATSTTSLPPTEADVGGQQDRSCDPAEIQKHFPEWMNVSVDIQMIHNPSVELNTLTMTLYIKSSFDTGCNRSKMFLQTNPTASEAAFANMLYVISDRQPNFDYFSDAANVVFMHPPGSDTGFLFTRAQYHIDCNFDLYYYPFDPHYCVVYLAVPLGFGEDNITLRWSETDPLFLSPNYGLSKFNLLLNSTRACDMDYANCLAIDIKISRYTFFFYLSAIIPAIAVVFISMISFFVNPEVVSARVSIGVTTVLTLFTLSLRHTQQDLTALDFYFVTCLAFVIVALFEFAFVHFLATQAARMKKEAQKNGAYAGVIGFKDSGDPPARSVKTPRELELKAAKIAALAKKIDHIMRYAWPSLFVLFLLYFLLITSGWVIEDPTVPSDRDYFTKMNWIQYLNRELPKKV